MIFRVFQQALMTLGGTLSLPFILASLFCPENENEVRAQLLSITMFMCGIATILQCVLGVRYTKLLLYYSNKLYFHIHWHVKWYNVNWNLGWIKPGIILFPLVFAEISCAQTRHTLYSWGKTVWMKVVWDIWRY